jgi:predicted dehydrogenase
MNEYPKKILFLGLGGAGQRHLRIAKKECPNSVFYGFRRKRSTPLLNPDFTVSKDQSLEAKYNIQMLNSEKDFKNIRPNLTIIATPSSLHFSDIISSAEIGSDIIVEKPGSMNSKEAQEIKKVVLKNKVKFLVSFQRRFHPLVKEFKKNILNNKLGKILEIAIITQSFVPDWHPYEPFKDLYACKKELGGGVVPTEIHEIDIINWIFGKPNKINIKSSNISNYNLDVEDTASITLLHNDIMTNANICFMSKDPKREILVTGELGFMKLDLLEQTLLIDALDLNQKIIHKNMDNDEQFKTQLRFFIDEFDNTNHIYLDTIINNSKIIEKR